jgi:uncharacterized protein DUF4235
MKLLYKPFAIVAGIVSARLGRKAFQQLWFKLDKDPPPRSSTAEASTVKVVGAAALQAATMAAVAAFVDRQSRRWFQYLTGFWPNGAKAKAVGQEVAVPAAAAVAKPAAQDAQPAEK